MRKKRNLRTIILLRFVALSTLLEYCRGSTNLSNVTNLLFPLHVDSLVALLATYNPLVVPP
jgi:hypothetical protein